MPKPILARGTGAPASNNTCCIYLLNIPSLCYLDLLDISLEINLQQYILINTEKDKLKTQLMAREG